jgi:hypothetical protein
VSRQEDQAIGRVIAAGERETEANAQIRNLERATERDGTPDVMRVRRSRLVAAYEHQSKTLKQLQATNLALLRVIRNDGDKRADPSDPSSPQAAPGS